MTLRLKRFRDRHKGERCVLVCNGPSLNQMDLSPLRHETVIGLNKIYLGLSEFGFYPKYLVAVNEKVIAQSVADLRALNCVKFISNKGSHLMDEDALTFYINTKSPRDRFCPDITKGVREGGTVTYAALQVAWYMGFSEVVIVGMDHRFEYTGAPHESHKMEGPDPNHFTGDYFGGQVWDNPDLVRSEESYEFARARFAAQGRRIVDATVDGACNVFEKRDFRDIFEG